MRLATVGAKVEAPYQRNGVLVRLRGGSRIVCAKFEQKEQHNKEQIKTIITSNTKNNTQ